MESSKSVFSGLDDGDYKILRILAQRGPLNQKEIGMKTSIGSKISFDRWGVRKRLEGTINFVGLIPNEFVYAVKRNHKEVRYELTLKGLLAILAENEHEQVYFEQVYLIQRYKRFLRRYNNDPQIIRWAIDFIKSEIALILYYNYARGFDWTRLMITKRYWNDFKKYDHNVIRNYFVDTNFFNEQKSTGYYIIKNEYLKNFFILDECTEPIPLGETKDWYQDDLEFKESFRKYVDRWYQYIDDHKLSQRMLGPSLTTKDIVPYYDGEFWSQERKEPQKQAYIELRKKGFKK